MSDIVVVRHPAIVRLVPARSRAARTVVAAMESPARIPERDPGDLAPLATFPAGPRNPERRVLAGADGLWEAVHDAGGRPVDGRGFADWASGRPCPEAVSLALDERLDGSPLAAHGNGGAIAAGRIARAFRGEPIDPDDARHIAHDGREDARLSLGAYIGGETALVGGTLHLRCRPVALLDLWPFAPTVIAPRFAHHDFRTLPLRPAGWAEAAGSSPVPPRIDPGPLRAWLELERHWPDDLEDVRTALNAWSGPLRRLLDAASRQPWCEAEGKAEIAAVRDVLVESELAALTGQAGRVSTARPFAALVRAAALAARHVRGRGTELDLPGFHARLVRLMAPRLADAPAPDARPIPGGP